MLLVPTQKHRYSTPKRYTPEELYAAQQADYLADAEHAERQADGGPFYPERGITRETLLAYAAECRAKLKA